MSTDFDSFDQSPLGAFVESPLNARNQGICTCVPVLVASFVTNRTSPSRRCWNLRPYQAPFRASSCSGFWRLIEIGCCYPRQAPWYGAGCVSDTGILLRLPPEFGTPEYYDGYMELQIGCPSADRLTINWPVPVHTPVVGDHCAYAPNCQILTNVFPCDIPFALYPCGSAAAAAGNVPATDKP